MKNFIFTLNQNTSLEVITGLDLEEYPQHRDAIMTVDIILTRNRILKQANTLLALQPRNGLPIGSKSGIWRQWPKWADPTKLIGMTT
jgi:hypothetical protein